MLYFDNAATTQLSENALKALIDVSRDSFGNASSIYSYGRKSKAILTEAREIIAQSIGARSSEIYFTSCGTESDNWAISQVNLGGFASVITSRIEHHAVLGAIERLEKDGYRVAYLPVGSDGVVSADRLKEVIGNGSEKHFVSVMFQNNETGILQPISEIARIVHSTNPGSIVHTDAVQAIGHFPIDVHELGIDMLSASAHKFNGPKGVGFLYARDGLDLMPMILGGGQERMMRSGTENVAGVYSMAKALEENINNLDEHIERVRILENVFLSILDEEGISYQINGAMNHKAVGVLNISFHGVDGEALLNALDAQGICISTGSACNSKSQVRSYVLGAMGLSEEQIDSSVRISIGVFNNKTEVMKIADSICKYIKLVGRMQN